MTRDGGRGDDGAPGRGENRPEGGGYPLLFKQGGAKAPKGVVERILALFREAPEASPKERSEDAGHENPSRTPQDSAGGRTTMDPWGATPTPAPPPHSVEPPESEPGSGPTTPRAGRPAPPLERSRPSMPLHRSTLQMLPGRLQPMDWKVLAQEVRFLRPTNPEQEVTLGRKRADPPDHVTIDHPSVKELHARMRYRDGEWWIESLAAEDPVRLNDRPVRFADVPRLLMKGDRVALGDIEFRYMGT